MSSPHSLRKSTSAKHTHTFKRFVHRKCPTLIESFSSGQNDRLKLETSKIQNASQTLFLHLSSASFQSSFHPCFSSLFSHLLFLIESIVLFHPVGNSAEAETDARAASEERNKVEQARARERECWSVRPCGFRTSRARASECVCVCVCVCVRERVTVSELVGEEKTERNERALCWLARGSAVRGARDWRECDPCQVSGVRDLHQLH